ncbi:MAG: hypothetical protein E6G06_22235 [Actinobacteria bacterium]|nr:MAG: hypothetical protein E6G06_22235 [Actinomycetota bacterium]
MRWTCVSSPPGAQNTTSHCSVRGDRHRIVRPAPGGPRTGASHHRASAGHRHRLLPLRGRGGRHRALARGPRPQAPSGLRVPRGGTGPKRGGCALGGRGPGRSPGPRPRVAVVPERPAGLRGRRRRRRAPGARARPSHPHHHPHGRKGVTVPLAPRTARALDLAVGERCEGPILLGAYGARLDRHAAARIVRRLARRAGIAKRVGPHTLRHAFITAALDAGVPLRDVQEAASHADTRTTMRYDRGRVSLDRHATYIVATFLAGAAR